MSWDRGLQSAIFFYLSCAPCIDARYRKKRRKEAMQGRAEREALAAEMPDMYRHPSPTGTNPHWQTEIDLGPTLVARKPRPADNGKRGRAGTWKTQGSGESRDGNGSSMPSSVDLSSNGGSRGSTEGRNDSKLAIRQTPGSLASTERLGSETSLSGSGVTKPAKARMRLTDPSRSYSTYRSPTINDLHPATVTNIYSREEAQFLMEGPPTSDVMSGRDRTARSRSDSGGSSRLSGRSALPLSREISYRLMERRLNGADLILNPTTSRESSAMSASYPTGQRHDRISTDEKDFALIMDSPTKARRSPVWLPVSEDSSKHSAATVVHSPDMAPEPLQRLPNRKVASRPQLSTILSDSVATSDEDDVLARPAGRLDENSVPSPRQSEDDYSPDRRRHRSEPLVQDDSLKVLRDLAPHSAIFKTHIVSSDDVRRQSKTDTRHARDASPQVNSDDAAELCDAWHDMDYADLDWIHEHTKRDVKQRWSMDI